MAIYLYLPTIRTNNFQVQTPKGWFTSLNGKDLPPWNCTISIYDTVSAMLKDNPVLQKEAEFLEWAILRGLL